MKSFNGIFIFLFLLNFSAKAQKDNSSSQQIYLITRFAHGFKDISWLYLNDANISGIAVDSAMVMNELFYFKSKETLSENFKPYALRTKPFSDYKMFWIQNKPVIFSGVKGDFRNYLINCSAFQQHIEAFYRFKMPLLIEIDSLRGNFGNADSVAWKKINNLERKLKEKVISFIKANATSAMSAYLLSLNCKEWRKKVSIELFSMLSLEVQQSEFWLTVKKITDTDREIEKGERFVDFQQPSPSGSSIRLSSLAGNYTLLDFLDSWCSPCRKENPNIVALYNKYKNRGFKVFCVSLDISASAWKKSFTDDKLTWSNVSELKGSKNDAVLIYGVYEIPANYLIERSEKLLPII